MGTRGPLCSSVVQASLRWAQGPASQCVLPLNQGPFPAPQNPGASWTPENFKQVTAHGTPSGCSPGRGELCWESLTFWVRQSPVGGGGELGGTWWNTHAIVRLGWGCGLARRQTGLDLPLLGGPGQETTSSGFSLHMRSGIHPSSSRGTAWGLTEVRHVVY